MSARRAFQVEAQLKLQLSCFPRPLPFVPRHLLLRPAQLLFQQSVVHGQPASAACAARSFDGILTRKDPDRQSRRLAQFPSIRDFFFYLPSDEFRRTRPAAPPVGSTSVRRRATGGGRVACRERAQSWLMRRRVLKPTKAPLRKRETGSACSITRGLTAALCSHSLLFRGSMEVHWNSPA